MLFYVNVFAFFLSILSNYQMTHQRLNKFQV